MHQQVLCVLAEVFVDDALLPQDILNMAQNSIDLMGDSENLGETEVSSGTLQEKVQDYIDFEESQRELTSCGNEVGAGNTKNREVTTETDKGSMVLIIFALSRSSVPS
ncbi:hypothetical protein AVEN_52368-1 [Araneus ventricosus]|uniref:Uncharacterized protein n=1 Tax=Araneus ventricosus TaxID=182803 RepID=A0A4Y2N8M8_ARAVE|nr:hypothetical protein AVEN_79530-1 [Araneus ventricosus]GBO32726.1 hypothetical protein AVEN_52368-1 [Araneus ventricosus]